MMYYEVTLYFTPYFRVGMSTMFADPNPIPPNVLFNVARFSYWLIGRTTESTSDIDCEHIGALLDKHRKWDGNLGNCDLYITLWPWADEELLIRFIEFIFNVLHFPSLFCCCCSSSTNCHTASLQSASTTTSVDYLFVFVLVWSL